MLPELLDLTDRLQGPCTLVLLVLAACAVVISIDRLYTLAEARRESKEYAPKIARMLKERRLKEAIAISSSKNYRYSHLARVVLGGLQELQFQQVSNAAATAEQVVAKVQRTTEMVTDLTSHDLRANLHWLTAIGATSPFIGALSGSARIAAAGLVLAIGSIWVSAHVKRRINYLDTEMRNAASELVDYIETVVR